MPWKQQGGGGGGPWGGGGGGGPWGGGGPGGPQAPDFEELLRRGQDRVKNILPGGKGGMGALVGVIAVALGIWAMTGAYRVQPDQVGVELVFGKMTYKTGPGLHWNYPSPIGQVELPQVTKINEVQIGFRSNSRVNARMQPRKVPEESLMLTGDEKIIDVQFAVFWKIDTRDRAIKRTVVKDGKPTVVEVPVEGIRNFLFNIRNPEETVKAASEAAMRETIGKSQFEVVRTQGRVAVEKEVKSVLQSILDDYSAGIEITDVQLQSVDPPGKVLDAFRDVQAARADKDTAMNKARAYYNEKTERANGEAEQIVRAAEGYRAAKIATADGEAQRFLKVFKEYKNQPFVTRRRIYLETMREVFKGMDKVLIDNRAKGSGVVPYLPLDQLSKPRSTPSAENGATTGGTGR